MLMGMVRCSMLADLADGLAVASIEEAIEQEYAIDSHFVVGRGGLKQNMRWLIQYNLWVTVANHVN